MPRGPDSDEGRIEIEISGPWAETILWEVPLMATLSEIYYSSVDKDWSYDGQAGMDRFRRSVCRTADRSAHVYQNSRTKRVPSCSRRAVCSANLARGAGARMRPKTSYSTS